MRWLLSLLLLYLPCTLAAQQLPLETYTPANGLVDARVNRVFQDSKGRIFFLTREGFSIFDGQRFSNHGNEGNKRTEIINGITEYSDGSVRLFSFDGNIYEVNGNKVSIDSSQRKLLTEANTVIDIAPDEKLVLTNYLLLSEKNRKLSQVRLPYAFSGTPRIENIFWYDPYIVILRRIPGTGSRIYLFNYRTRSAADSLTVNEVSLSTSDKKGNIFLLTKGWQQINTEMLASGTLAVQPAWFSSSVPPPFSDAVLSFDNNNDPWLADGEKGYYRAGKPHEYFTVSQGFVSGARYVFQDAENNYWFISSVNGVQKMQQSPLSKKSSFNDQPLGYVTSIGKDENGNIFCTTSNGIFLNEEKITAFDPSLQQDPFFFQGQVWKFTDYKNLKSNKGIHFYLPDHISDFSRNDLSTVHKTIDREGRMLIAGVILFVIDKELKLHTYRLPYFCDNIIVDDNNNYWCFARSNDVVKLAWRKGHLTEVYRQNIPGLNPRYVLQWDARTFIVGTRFEGIKFFSLENDRLRFITGITRKNGLSNNFIYSLLKKKDKQLLVGTGTGLVLISFRDRDTIIENLSLRNNIFPPFVTLVSTADSSALCLTGSGELYRLQNDTKFSSGYNPSAFFRSVSVNGAEVDPSKNDFTYSRNNFSFSISAPTFLDNKNMRFAFLLSSGDRRWQQYSNAADFGINNLPPGKYTLTATVQYPGKYYPDKQLVYDFNIQNPYWKQWWFIALWVIMLIVVVYLVINSYYRKKLEKQQVIVEKQQAVEKERSRIAADMHDDLGSGLTKITYLSQMAMVKGNHSTDLQAIKKTSTELVENMSEIIWAMKEENNSLEDLLYYIKQYAVEYCTANGLNCFVSLPEKIRSCSITGQDRRNIYLAVKETLHNIVKHAAAANVSIDVKIDDLLSLSIKDDGKGIDLAHFNAGHAFGGNGLKNIRSRIGAVQGSLEIRNVKGTELVFHIPLNHDPFVS